MPRSQDFTVHLAEGFILLPLPIKPYFHSVSMSSQALDIFAKVPSCAPQHGESGTTSSPGSVLLPMQRTPGEGSGAREGSG